MEDEINERLTSLYVCTSRHYDDTTQRWQRSPDVAIETARMPAYLRADKNIQRTDKLQTYMQKDDVPKSSFEDYQEKAKYLYSDKCVFQFPALPSCVDKILGIKSVNETIRIEKQDISRALSRNVGLKRTHSGSDETDQTSGYESDSEGDTEIQKSRRKKLRTESNKAKCKQLQQQIKSEQKERSHFNSHHSRDMDQSSVYECCHISVQNSSNPSASSESCSSNSSDSDCSSEFDPSDDCSTDSSDDSSMETSSDSYSSSLGLSLSDSTTSEDDSDEADDNVNDATSARPSLLPDVVSCMKSCVCKTGSRSPPTPIPRRGGVIIPLYKRLLSCRLLNAAIVSKFACCKKSCYKYWLNEFHNND